MGWYKKQYDRQNGIVYNPVYGSALTARKFHLKIRVSVKRIRA